MGKILLIGSTGSGKTSLKQVLQNEQVNYRKTQMLTFSDLFIDCPGEYLDIPRYYHVMIDASHRVSEVWALQDATKSQSQYPPNFAKVFKKPTFGIITKIDSPLASIPKARALLTSAGFSEPFYTTSIYENEGINQLELRVKLLSEREVDF